MSAAACARPDATVALFVTCVVDQRHARRSGSPRSACSRPPACTVEFPAAQTCCGQPAVNAGEPEAAARLARHFLDVFEPYDVVVAPSGSCAAMVAPLVRRGCSTGRDASGPRALAARTYELSQYLVDGWRRPTSAPASTTTVTVHDACHGLRNLGVARRAPARCSRAAGADDRRDGRSRDVLRVRRHVLGRARRDRGPARRRQARARGARPAREWLVSGDVACLLHLEGRRRRTGVGPEPVHLADLLAAGLPLTGPGGGR